MIPQSAIWAPSQEAINKSNITHFLAFLNQAGINLNSFTELELWSVKHNAQFWSMFWDFSGIVGNKGEQVIEHSENIINTRFFHDSKVNYAENLLQYDGKDKLAIIFQSENQITRQFTWDELKNAVARTQQQLRKHGIKQGDRVAGVMANTPEAVIAALATASLGAVWTSCSPDFGVTAIIERFQQVKPRLLFFTESYLYNGKTFPCVEKAHETMQLLTSCKTCVLVPLDTKLPASSTPNHFDSIFAHWQEWQHTEPAPPLTFKRVSFNSLLFIMYSSGTTGKPKCIVHGVGGTLIEHLKEHQLHCDIKQDDRVFYFTTCSWMMWNWQISSLASNATLVLFDGSPFAAHPELLFEYAQKHQVTLFGTSAQYLSILEKNKIDIRSQFPLESLRTITSAGSPLLNNSYDYVYQFIKKDVLLASISGGTDIIGCFFLCCPILPVFKGEIQCKSLGLDVKVFDDEGLSIEQKKGELVCCNAFPSMPIYFWNDDNQAIYKKAYFKRFSHVWLHGDFTSTTDNRGYIIYGRSDTILNPGGVRIGTAEIYTCLEFFTQIVDSVIVGIPHKNDIQIFLFIVLVKQLYLDDSLIAQIKRKIKLGSSPRHVPHKIIAVPDIPKTHNGKISEVAVKNALIGTTINNTNSLLNPGSLEHFKCLNLHTS